VTDQEQNRFEAELREIKVARLPEDFRSRLLAGAPPTKASPVRRPWPAPVALGWQRVLRFFLPTAAAAVLTVIVVHQALQRRPAVPVSPARLQADAAQSSAAVSPQANDVEIAKELVSSVDMLATLPTGEPVRFQYQRWVDKVTLTDKSRGLVVEERTPRVEFIPVRFETY
jgi:hypothetical protein